MPDAKPTILGLGISMPIIAIIGVALRVQARRIKKVQLGADDYSIFIALILAVAFAIDVLIDSRLGNLGGHQLYTSAGLPVSIKQNVIFAKANYAAQLLWLPTVGITKISILLLYKRIFVGTRFRKLVWSVIAFVSLWTFAFWFALLFGCIPISATWNLAENGRCVNTEILYTVGSVTDVLGDVLILILPVYNVLKLQMPMKRKIAVILTFLLGSLVTVAGVVRLVFVINAFSGLRNRKHAPDGSYLFAPAIYWTLIETSLGVVSACLPVMRPLYKQYSLDSLVRSVRTIESSRMLGFRTSFEALRGKSADTLGERNGHSISTDANDPYFTGNGRNGNILPLEAYKINVGSERAGEDLQYRDGIHIKSELSQDDNVV